MAQVNYRTVPVDAYDPDAPCNFDLASLRPDVAPSSAADVQTLTGQVRQLLRGGDGEGALRGALETAPYGADEKAKVSFGFGGRGCCGWAEMGFGLCAGRTGG